MQLLMIACAWLCKTHHAYRPASPHRPALVKHAQAHQWHVTVNLSKSQLLLVKPQEQPEAWLTARHDWQMSTFTTTPNMDDTTPGRDMSTEMVECAEQIWGCLF